MKGAYCIAVETFQAKKYVEMLLGNELDLLGVSTMASGGEASTSFFVLRSSFFVLRFSFFVLRFSFFVLRSSSNFVLRSAIA